MSMTPDTVKEVFHNVDSALDELVNDGIPCLQSMHDYLQEAWRELHDAVENCDDDEGEDE